MTRVVFWEKPGCAGNAKQQALLRASGHELEIRDLLAEPWSADRLRRFFGDRPVAEWFNRQAPCIKSGALRPETLTDSEALAAMIAEPLLIRRPLLEALGRREVGFDPPTIAAWIGLSDPSASVGEGCARIGAARCRP